MHDHCDPKIIHRDVKAANILLDEEFEAVVGDFGLAKLMDYKDTHVTTAVRGTIGHIAPEYLSTGKSSEKTDVFGYGVMLLELITGQRAFDLARLANDDDVMLLDWVWISFLLYVCMPIKFLFCFLIGTCLLFIHISGSFHIIISKNATPPIDNCIQVTFFFLCLSFNVTLYVTESNTNFVNLEGPSLGN